MFFVSNMYDFSFFPKDEPVGSKSQVEASTSLCAFLNCWGKRAEANAQGAVCFERLGLGLGSQHPNKEDTKMTEIFNPTPYPQKKPQKVASFFLGESNQKKKKHLQKPLNSAVPAEFLFKKLIVRKFSQLGRWKRHALPVGLSALISLGAFDLRGAPRIPVGHTCRLEQQYCSNEAVNFWPT